jgi:AcrR family transcriptional regulator
MSASRSATPTASGIRRQASGIRTRGGPRTTPAAAPDEGARGRILDAAIELFALHGLHGMSLQMLADHVGLHKSSLFHHFSGKDELSIACLERVMEALLPVVAPLNDDDGTNIDVIVRGCEAMADHFSTHSTAALFLTRSLIGGQDRIAGDARIDIAQVVPFFFAISGWLDRARRSGTIRQIRVRHGLVNLMGLVLFYPSIAGGFGKGLLGFDPTSARAAKARREELGTLIRAALAPTSPHAAR